MKDAKHAFNAGFLVTLILISSFASAQWVQKANALKPRSELGETIIYNSKLYSFVGFSDEARHAEPTSEIYDPVTNKWSYLASMPPNTAMTHQDIILVDNTVWHIGGRVGQNPGPMSSAIWIYNISTNSWSRGPEILDPATGNPMTIAASASVLLGRVLHIFGGFTPTACSNDQDKYHLTLDVDTWLLNPSLPPKWENKLKPLPMKRNHLSAVTLAGKIYAFGGQTEHDCSGAKDVAYCHVYNPSTDTWKQLPSLPTARSHAEGSTFAIDGKIYIVGGQGSDGKSTTKVTIFDPAANGGAGKWTENTSLALPYIYEGLSATVIGTNFIISHGSRGSSKYPQKTTFSRTITRNPVYKFGFPSECINLSDSSLSSRKGRTWLYTIDGSKSYTLTSNASWLVINKNANGVATPNSVNIEVTANTTGLAPGTYNAVITATGTGGGTNYTAATLCIKLTVKALTAYDLLVTSNGAGTVAKNPNLDSYTSGTNVILTATPEEGHQFTGWSGDTSGVQNPLTIKMFRNKSITATFVPIPHYNLSVSTNGDGSVDISPIQATYIKNSKVTLTAIPEEGQRFTGWSGDGTGITNPLSITMDKNKSIIATFAPIPHYTLSVSSSGDGGSVDISPDQTSYTENSMVTLTAIPEEGQQFTGWSGDATGNSNPLNVIMEKNKSIAATFAPISYYNLSVSFNGNGSIDVNPEQPSYKEGSNITLTAIPEEGQKFTGWSGNATGITNPLSITMDNNKSIIANFAPILYYNLSVSSNGDGSIDVDPNQSSYKESSNVTLTAVPEEGQKFTGWSGDVSGITNPLNVTMDKAKSITANFAPIPHYNLFVSSNGDGNVDLSSIQSSYKEGTSVTLTAIPDTGQQFTGWSGDVTGNINPLTITMNMDKAIIANFSPVSSFAISNITYTTNRTYTLGQLVAGTTVYTDRTYEVTGLPAFLNNTPFIKTPNDDKNNKSANVLSFDINQNATIYIAYDPRATALPAWLSTWQKVTGQQINISDAINSAMLLYSKTYAAGRVSLGGNLQSPAAGSASNYFVIIQPSSTSVQYNLNVTVTGNGTITKSPDQASYVSNTNVTISATPASGYQFTGWSGDATGNTNPLTIVMNTNKVITANFSALPSFAISNITTTGGRAYTLSNLVSSNTVYTDRDYKATGIPSTLNNAPLIKTPNDDKSVKSSSVLSFNINQNATVYIAYDPRATALPAWLASWQKVTGQQIVIADAINSAMTLYTKSYTAGKITLGGNLQSPAAGSKTNYFVVIKPQQSQQRAANNNFYNPGVNPVVQKDVEKFTIQQPANLGLKFNIYPNPNHGNTFYIKANNFSKYAIVTITLHNELGSMIQSVKVTADKYGAFNKDFLLRRNLNKGSYIITAVSQFEKVQTKLVIN